MAEAESAANPASESLRSLFITVDPFEMAVILPPTSCKIRAKCLQDAALCGFRIFASSCGHFCPISDKCLPPEAAN
jgi:hypothetical protein